MGNGHVSAMESGTTLRYGKCVWVRLEKVVLKAKLPACGYGGVKNTGRNSEGEDCKYNRVVVCEKKDGLVCRGTIYDGVRKWNMQERLPIK